MMGNIVKIYNIDLPIYKLYFLNVTYAIYEQIYNGKKGCTGHTYLEIRLTNNTSFRHALTYEDKIKHNIQFSYKAIL